MKKIFTACFMIFFATLAQAEIVVIGNLKNNLQSLNSIQVEDIFMGRTRSLPNGRVAIPVDQSNLRPEFYQKLTARPIEQINAYWARIMFTGQTSPPMILADDNAVLTIVNENRDAIGYIDKKNVDSRVRILLIIN
jgi:ABC-type phosphate transport system substrate-binding protein